MKAVKFLIFALVLAGAIFFGWKYWQLKLEFDNSNVLSGIHEVNGRMEVKRIDVASLYPGKVEAVLVEEGDDITKGQLLVRLSSSQTASQVKMAEAQKERASQAVSRARSEARALKEQLRISEIELNEAKKMRAEKLISQTELERRVAALKAQQEKYTALNNAEAEALAEVKRATALIEQTSSADEDMLIRSPLDGYVEYKLADVGNVVGSGGRVVSVLDPSDVSMDVFLPSEETTKVRVGDDARIVIEGLDAVFPAKVSFIARDAQYTPKFVETAQERAKLLFRITLRIPKDTALKYRHLLKGGMTSLGYVNYSNVAWPQRLNVKLPRED